MAHHLDPLMAAAFVLLFVLFLGIQWRNLSTK